MAKTLVPQIAGSGEECSAAKGVLAIKWVERTGATGRHDVTPGGKGLHRKTGGVKLNRDIVIGRKFTNRDKILNDRRADNYIVEREICGRERGGADASNGEAITVADNYVLKKDGTRRGYLRYP